MCCFFEAIFLWCFVMFNFQGLRKVTDDMKTKNRTDRTSLVGTTEKEPRTSTFSFSKVGPPKLELQMGRK